MLTLPIKKQWFDMILSGEKREEYREMKPFYKKRFENILLVNVFKGNINEWLLTDVIFNLPVRFRNGYSSDSPSFIADCELTRGYGRPEWGAEPGKEYYVLKILEHSCNSEITPIE